MNIVDLFKAVFFDENTVFFMRMLFLFPLVQSLWSSIHKHVEDKSYGSKVDDEDVTNDDSLENSTITTQVVEDDETSITTIESINNDESSDESTPDDEGLEEFAESRFQITN